MNYEEEQKNELEALSEIYYNEIEVISSKAPIAFSIKIKPQDSAYEGMYAQQLDDDCDSDDSSSDQEESATTPQNFSVDLLFEMPSKYPDEKPHIEVIDSSCLDDGDIARLLEKLNRKAGESLGTMMIFTLVNDVVEWLSNKCDDDAHEIELEREKVMELEREESKRFDGTPVTEQTFLAWKSKFDAELLKARLEQQKLQSEHGVTATNRLTGREMFETDKTLIESDLNFVEDLDHSQLEALMQNLDEFELENSDTAYSDHEECEEDEEEDEDFDPEDSDTEEEDSKEKSARTSKSSKG